MGRGLGKRVAACRQLIPGALPLIDSDAGGHPGKRSDAARAGRRRGVHQEARFAFTEHHGLSAPPNEVFQSFVVQHMATASTPLCVHFCGSPTRQGSRSYTSRGVRQWGTGPFLSTMPPLQWSPLQRCALPSYALPCALPRKGTEIISAAPKREGSLTSLQHSAWYFERWAGRHSW